MSVDDTELGSKKKVVVLNPPGTGLSSSKKAKCKSYFGTSAKAFNSVLFTSI